MTRKRNKPYGFSNFDLKLLLPNWPAGKVKALVNMAKAVKGKEYERMPSRLLTRYDLLKLERAIEKAHAENLENL